MCNEYYVVLGCYIVVMIIGSIYAPAIGRWIRKQRYKPQAIKEMRETLSELRKGKFNGYDAAREIMNLANRTADYGINLKTIGTGEDELEALRIKAYIGQTVDLWGLVHSPDFLEKIAEEYVGRYNYLISQGGESLRGKWLITEEMIRTAILERGTKQ
jgi:hypothetical protein